MSSSKPPALATWLLEHLAMGGNREALAGDLLEQFSQHRSSAWYWRQVLAAVALGLWNERRILWIAIGFTMLWRALPPQFHLRLFSIVNTSGIFLLGLPWPLSAATSVGYFGVMNGLPLLAALCVYLAMTRSFSLRRLTGGLLVGLLALPLIVSPVLALLSAIRWYRVPSFVVYVLASLPLFVSMLLSMWAAALPERAGRLPDLEGEQA